MTSRPTNSFQQFYESITGPFFNAALNQASNIVSGGEKSSTPSHPQKQQIQHRQCATPLIGGHRSHLLQRSQTNNTIPTASA